MSLQLPASFVNSVPLPEAGKVALADALQKEAPTSIRINKFKAALAEPLPQVPWCTDGYYVKPRPRFTSDPALHAGAYYVQEASSMLIEAFIVNLGLQESALTALDLCAAPGGKTTLLRNTLHPRSFLLANEVVGSRVNLLIENLSKWGISGVAVSQSESYSMGRCKEMFDLILVDAPCSGEGLFRKNNEAIAEWSPAGVRMCAERQRDILEKVWPALKSGGILIYSTCTYNLAENEENLLWLTQTKGADPLELKDVPQGVVRSEFKGAIGYRCYPHLVQGEGFFAGAVRKPGKPSKAKPVKPIITLKDWMPGAGMSATVCKEHQVYAVLSEHTEVLAAIGKLINIRYLGLPVGKYIKGHFKPSQGYATLAGNADDTPVAALELAEALAFLKCEDGRTELFPKGIVKVVSEGLALGYARNDGHRLISLYPKEWRVRTANPEDRRTLVKAI